MILLKVFASTIDDCVGRNCAALPKVSANETQLKSALTMAFGTIAAVAIITLMIAAINFATAGSDTEKISRSKKAIIYALIGLSIAVLAETIVLTMLGKF